MSIEEQSITKTTTGQAAEPAPPAAPERAAPWWRQLLSPLWLCLLGALLVRVWLVAHTNLVVNGDEALVGIQAQHILRGEFPLYYYGQPYMGSLEAYLMAIIIAVAGSSAWTLRAEPMLLSLVVVWLTWRLAAALADFAQLPPSARTVFQTVAALFAALPPLYDTVLELRTLGGYVETFALMLLLLLSALQLTRRWHAGASGKELALRWAGIGFIVGLGFWVDPLIISAVLAAAAWILLFFIVELFQMRNLAPAERQSDRQRHVGNLFLVVAGIPAALVGALPALIWGLANHWQNIQYFFQIGSGKAGGSSLSQRVSLARGLFRLYKDTVASHVIGGSLPIESAALTRFFTIAFAITMIVIAITALLVVFSVFWDFPLLTRIQRLAALPLIFAIATAAVFCGSTVAASGLTAPQIDAAGRYATPIMLALPFFFATLITIASMLLRNGSKIGNQQQEHKVEKQAAAPASAAPSTKSARPVLPLALQGVFFALLALYLAVSAFTYGQADPAYTFQSPSCPIAPANDAPIIAYLEQQHVHYAWALSWIGYPITFKTQGQIVFADPRLPANVGTGRNLSVRMPEYQNSVLHADRPAILTFVQHDDTYPALLIVLNGMGITYQARRFPSEPGTDVLVVTALSRPLTIESSAIFRGIFRNCV